MLGHVTIKCPERPSSNITAGPQDHPHYNKAFRIRLRKHVGSTVADVFFTWKGAAEDESMIPFKGRTRRWLPQIYSR